MKNVIIITVFAIIAYFGAMFLLELRTDKAFSEVCSENGGTYDAGTNVCDLGTEVIDVPDLPDSNPQKTPEEIAEEKIEAKSHLIVVNDLMVGQSTASPLTITGQAVGNWFFEASFPVFVKDSSGATIGTGIAEAQADWMTTSFVPFEVSITFATQPAGSVGSIVFEKDNPSGLPENGDSLVYPISF